MSNDNLEDRYDPNEFGEDAKVDIIRPKTMIDIDNLDKWDEEFSDRSIVDFVPHADLGNIIKNQYSDLVPSILFKEYERATEEQKQKIEEFIFKKCREVNELPKNIITMDSDSKDFEESSLYVTNMLRPLAAAGDCYNGRDYGLNTAGIDLLYDFFPNIWDVTKKTAPMSVRQGFFYDDKLKKAIKKTLRYSDSILDLIKWLRMAGLGYCVNFRPAVAKTLYETHAPKNAKVYDYANGYGARCLGAFMASNVREYVSVDVNTETVNNTHKLQKCLLSSVFGNNEKEMTTYLCGSEEFLQKYPQYKGYFDLSFSSPQYFNTEIYSQEETQSCHKYPQYKLWLRDFYRPTIHNAIDVLKDGGVYIINIFEKLPSISGATEDFDLKKMTKVFAAEKGFYLYKCDRYLLRTMPGAGKRLEDNTYEKRDRTIGLNFEAVWMFKHYETLKKEGLINDEQYLKFKENDKTL